MNLPELNPHFVTDRDGKRLSVQLLLEEYETILDRLEDLEDLEEARDTLAKTARGEEEIIPWEVVKVECGL